jgi:uncharacterized protein involved in exopolysaccharide biosynthesis
MMEDETYLEDEITLKEILRLIQEYWSYLWRKKLWIILGGILLGGFFVLRMYLEEKTYTADLTFIVNEDDGGSIGGVGAILGQFGLGGGGSEYNMDKMLELSQSRKIIQSVLFDSIVVDEKNDLLANHLIDVYELHEKWGKSIDPDLRTYKFTSSDFENFGVLDNKALISVYSLVVGSKNGDNKLFSNSYNEASGIITFEAETKSEPISFFLSQLIYDRLSSFYISKETEKSRFTYDQLAGKADSVKSALYSAEIQLARAQDRSLGIQQRLNKISLIRLQREVQILSILYGEILKNKETSEFLLNSATPFFQTIDRPILPLPKLEKSYPRTLVIGGILGGVLASISLLAYKLIKDTLKD